MQREKTNESRYLGTSCAALNKNHPPASLIKSTITENMSVIYTHTHLRLHLIRDGNVELFQYRFFMYVYVCVCDCGCVGAGFSDT